MLERRAVGRSAARVEQPLERVQPLRPDPDDRDAQLRPAAHAHARRAGGRSRRRPARRGSPGEHPSSSLDPVVVVDGFEIAGAAVGEDQRAAAARGIVGRESFERGRDAARRAAGEASPRARPAAGSRRRSPGRVTRTSPSNRRRSRELGLDPGAEARQAGGRASAAEQRAARRRRPRRPRVRALALAQVVAAAAQRPGRARRRRTGSRGRRRGRHRSRASCRRRGRRGSTRLRTGWASRSRRVSASSIRDELEPGDQQVAGLGIRARSTTRTSAPSARIVLHVELVGARVVDHADQPRGRGSGTPGPARPRCSPRSTRSPSSRAAQPVAPARRLIIRGGRAVLRAAARVGRLELRPRRRVGDRFAEAAQRDQRACFRSRRARRR